MGAPHPYWLSSSPRIVLELEGTSVEKVPPLAGQLERPSARLGWNSVAFFGQPPRDCPCVAPAIGAPEGAQTTFASSRLKFVPSCPAISDSIHDCLREAFAFLVAGLPLSGEELAYGTADLAIDIAEAVLLLLCLGLIPDGRQHFPKFSEPLVCGWPLGQSFP